MLLLLILLILLTVLTVYIRHLYTYWQRKGFPVSHLSIPFGCLDVVVKRKKSFGVAIYDVYRSTSENFVGLYFMHRPAILVRDAELVRDILVKDFVSFHDRGIYVDEENDPFSAQLFSLEGEHWRTLRNKLTPSFSSGKLKGMFGVIDEVGDNMLKYLDKIVPDEGVYPLEAKEFFNIYAIDIIGTTIFGLDLNSFENPNNGFRRFSKQLNKPNFISVLRGTAIFLYPSFEKFCVRLGIKDAAAEAMKDIVSTVVELREKHNVVRKDLMQLLIQLRNTGKINLDDNVWEVETAADSLKSMSIETLAGQCFLFYAAGTDTTASAAAFAMYELAKNPDALQKVQEDIEHALEKTDGKVTYDSIKAMKYLELCFMETIRKYTTLPLLNRQCTKDYQILGTDKVIEKGTPIVISLLGMHRDPKYFPNPMKWMPERFLESNRDYNPVAYMPFGEGPRHCIAQRMGKMNSMVALIKFLSHYDITVANDDEIEFENFSAGLVAKGGVNLLIKKKKKFVATSS